MGGLVGVCVGGCVVRLVGGGEGGVGWGGVGWGEMGWQVVVGGL